MNKDFIQAAQRLMQSWGEPLPKFGADGFWGAESEEAWQRLKAGRPNPALELPEGYLKLIEKIESGGRLHIKNPTTSASGLFQFIESTWKGYGGAWGKLGGVAFGGLKPDRAEQEERFKRFTLDNAKILRANNIPINSATLYAAHFLGAGGAAKILRVPDSTSIEKVTTKLQRKHNPSILKGTVGDFKAWLKRKTGVAP